ncbi:MAG: spore maturation protein [Lachnospiraceae bacterium]|nr:spore maturation protein [Lachnospiraceae bacterium]
MISYLSNSIIPILFFLIIFNGYRQKKDVYQEFLKGVTEGFHIVFEIAPTLIGLLLAVGMMRASGFLDFILKWLSPLAGVLNVPSDIIPVVITKLFSSSAATGLLLDIFKQYGPDSKSGFISSLILSSTETVFYTMSVYFSYIGVKKTRWTLPGALVSIIAGTIASILIGNYLF